MVSLIWATIAASSGLLVYLAIPFLAALGPHRWGESVGKYHAKLAFKALGQAAIVRRALGKFQLMSFDVDDERQQAEVTLSSSLTGSDKTHPFTDPDNRIKRLFKKPLAILPEGVPAAVDASVSEIGAASIAKYEDDGWVVTEPCETCGGTGRLDETSTCATCTGTGEIRKVDRYVAIDDGPRFVDPADAAPLVTKAVEPQWLATVRQLTKKRFEKYAGNVGAVELMATFTGFLLGVGAVAGLQYLEQKILDSGGGGAPDPGSTIGVGVGAIVDPSVLDAVVILA